MPGNFRLGLIEDFDKIADADLLIAHEIQQPQPSIVSERLEESLQIEGLLSHCHVMIIFALTYVSSA